MHRRRQSKLFSGKRSLPLKIGIGIVLVVLLLVLIIPSGKKTFSSEEITAIRKRGYIRVAVNSTPSTFFTENERGIEASIARNIAKAIFDDDGEGHIEYVRTSSSFIDSYFSDDSIDIALLQCPTGLYASRYSYSEPYYTDSCIIIIKNTQSPDMPLDNARIGYINKSITEKRIDSYAEKNKISVSKQKFPTYETMLYALQSENIDACVFPRSVYQMYSSAALIEHSIQLGDISYSVVCNKENAGLTELIDSVIHDMKSAGEIDVSKR